MDASALPSLVPFLINGGVALIVVFLLVFKFLVPGWLYSDQEEEKKELKRALAAERERSDTAVAAASSTRDILLSLRGRAYQEEVTRRADYLESEKNK